MNGLLLAIAACSLAEVSPSDMRFLSTDAVAMRDGVLMCRIGTGETGQPWPDRVMVDLIMDDGRSPELVGHIGWIEPMPDSSVPSWGSDRRTVWIRSVEPDDRFNTDGSKLSTFGPCLLVELPADGSGTLRLGRSNLQLRWVDLPEGMPAMRVGDEVKDGILDATVAPDLPALHNPLDWWRWELVAERRGLEPPPLPFDSTIQRLAARQVSGLWRVAMQRLAQTSRGVAARCRDLLTQNCMDGDIRIAAWITSPSSIENLLRLLMDDSINDDEIVKAALSWADDQISQFTWVEQPFGPDIRLQLANPDQQPVLAEFIWSNTNDVPIGLRLDPRRVTSTRVQRQGVTAADPYSRMDILNVIVRQHVLRLAFGDDVMPMIPPGPLLGPFIPSMTLAESRSQTIPQADSDRATWLQTRRRNGQWEIYIECMGMPDLEQDKAIKSLPENMKAPSDMIGIEAVTLFLARSDRGSSWPQNSISITPHAGWRQYQSTSSKQPLVDVRRQDDRWLATIILPDSWLPSKGHSLKTGRHANTCR